ncbi:MAG: DUF1289 domain-containing protein [Halopseudomonas yangmingensis]|nr:DUF1289 domain-containing protein [Halopseudomonas yangmingensis]
MSEPGRQPSPCVRRCCLNEQQRCLGCGRLLGEILEWAQASDERQRQIVAAAAARLKGSAAPD